MATVSCIKIDCCFCGERTEIGLVETVTKRKTNGICPCGKIIYTLKNYFNSSDIMPSDVVFKKQDNSPAITLNDFCTKKNTSCLLRDSLYLKTKLVRKPICRKIDFKIVTKILLFGFLLSMIISTVYLFQRVYNSEIQPTKCNSNADCLAVGSAVCNLEGICMSVEEFGKYVSEMALKHEANMKNYIGLAKKILIIAIMLPIALVISPVVASAYIILVIFVGIQPLQIHMINILEFFLYRFMDLFF